MKQTFKRFSSVFSALLLAVILTVGGAVSVFAEGEMDETMKQQIIVTAEGLTETIIPLSDEEIEAYKSSGDAFTESAMEAWQGAKAELGEMKEQDGYNTEVTYSDGQYVATVPVSFEKLDASFVYVIDEVSGPISLSVDVKYPLSTYMVGAAQNTVIGLGTVFIVLIFLSFVISLFRLIPSGNKKKAEEAPAPAPAAVVQEEVLTDDSELIAVIAAAIAASEGTGTDGFVVRSIRKVNRRK